MLLPTVPTFLWTALHRQYRWKIFCHVLGSFAFAGHSLTPFPSLLRNLGLHRAGGWLRPQGPQGGGLQEHSGHQGPAGAIQGGGSNPPPITMPAPLRACAINNSKAAKRASSSQWGATAKLTAGSRGLTGCDINIWLNYLRKFNFS